MIPFEPASAIGSVPGANPPISWQIFLKPDSVNHVLGDCQIVERNVHEVVPLELECRLDLALRQDPGLQVSRVARGGTPGLHEVQLTNNQVALVGLNDLASAYEYLAILFGVSKVDVAHVNWDPTTFQGGISLDQPIADLFRGRCYAGNERGFSLRLNFNCEEQAKNCNDNHNCIFHNPPNEFIDCSPSPVGDRCPMKCYVVVS